MIALARNTSFLSTCLEYSSSLLPRFSRFLQPVDSLKWFFTKRSSLNICSGSFSPFIFFQRFMNEILDFNLESSRPMSLSYEWGPPTRESRCRYSTQSQDLENYSKSSRRPSQTSLDLLCLCSRDILLPRDATADYRHNFQSCISD